MEVCITQTIGGQAVECGSLDKPTECAGGAKSHIIQEDPDNVWSAGGRFHGLRPPFFRLGEGSANDSLIWLLRRLRMQCEFRTRCKCERQHHHSQYAVLSHAAPIGLCLSVWRAGPP